MELELDGRSLSFRLVRARLARREPGKSGILSGEKRVLKCAVF